MRQPTLIVVVILTATLVAGAPPSHAQESVGAAQVETELTELMARFGEALAAGDADAMLELYADDPRFYWLEPGRRTYESKAEVEEGIRSAYGQIEGASIERTSMRVTVLSERHAVVTSSYVQTFRFRGSGGMNLDGVLTAVFEKRDGRWQAIVGHSTTLDTTMIQ